MKILPLGAVGEVTGSAYLVESDQSKVLVDFGMFQGSKESEAKNRLDDSSIFSNLDTVLVTHAHLDHVGRLPLLARAGIKPRILATPATRELASLILHDSARIQQGDLVRLNRQRARAGKEPLEPVYTENDVESTLSRFVDVKTGTPINVAPGMTALYAESGHILGSTSIYLTVQEKGKQHLVCFSGDIGPYGAPLLRDPDPLGKADLVFLESTYGDRDHRGFEATVKEFQELIINAVAQKKKVLVPTFAVGRAQLLMYQLAIMFREKMVPKIPIFIDSPMAIEASNIHMNHPELADEEAVAFMNAGRIRDELDSLQWIKSADESRSLNDKEGPCIILAGSGMCNAGRIIHHLRNNIWKPDTVVLFVGYQGTRTLGRQIVEGAEEIKIFGEKVAVKAEIKTMGGLSAHAGQGDLLRWFLPFAASKPRVVLTHGENPQRAALAGKIRELHSIESELPGPGAEIIMS